MQLFRELHVTLDDGPHIISFGIPDTKEEREAMYRLRYNEYSRRGYIDPVLFPDGIESDAFDTSDSVHHFIAVYDGSQVIGTVRAIQSTPLPTEEYFSLTSVPKEIQAIPKEKRIELGRLIVIPPDRERGVFLPRNIVMLFMFYTLSNYGLELGYEGGLSFIKEALHKKLKKVRFPINPLDWTDVHYPKGGILEPYFSQKDDPVIPVSFETKEVLNFCRRMVDNQFIFKKTTETQYELQSNVYTKFLKSIKVL